MYPFSLQLIWTFALPLWIRLYQITHPKLLWFSRLISRYFSTILFIKWQSKLRIKKFLLLSFFNRRIMIYIFIFTFIVIVSEISFFLFPQKDLRYHWAHGCIFNNLSFCFDYWLSGFMDAFLIIQVEIFFIFYSLFDIFFGFFKEAVTLNSSWDWFY